MNWIEELEGEEVKKISYAIIIVVAILFTPLPVEARSNSCEDSLHGLATHTFWIDSLSSRTFSVSCRAGDFLEGEFQLVQDGDRFPGDQTKYDNWLLGGIDFFICNETVYDTWRSGGRLHALFQRNDIWRLSWNVTIPAFGEWLIVYSNPSIYMMEVEGSYHHSSNLDPLFLGLVAVVPILFVLAGIKVRNARN